jgi:hypothetical protein
MFAVSEQVQLELCCTRCFGCYALVYVLCCECGGKEEVKRMSAVSEQVQMELFCCSLCSPVGEQARNQGCGLLSGLLALLVCRS